jgi:hypothetical protein
MAGILLVAMVVEKQKRVYLLQLSGRQGRVGNQVGNGPVFCFVNALDGSVHSIGFISEHKQPGQVFASGFCFFSINSTYSWPTSFFLPIISKAEVMNIIRE